MADELLKKDAERQGFIRPNGRGFSDYARSIGITTKKILETTYRHEARGFTEDQLGNLAEPSESAEEAAIMLEHVTERTTHLPRKRTI